MLSRARYEDEEDMVVEGDDVGTKFYTTSYVQKDHKKITWRMKWKNLKTCL